MTRKPDTGKPSTTHTDKPDNTRCDYSDIVNGSGQGDMEETTYSPD